MSTSDRRRLRILAAALLLLAGVVVACAQPGECKRSSDCAVAQSCTSGLCLDAAADPGDSPAADDSGMTTVGTPGADASSVDAAAE